MIGILIGGIYFATQSDISQFRVDEELYEGNYDFNDESVDTSGTAINWIDGVYEHGSSHHTIKWKIDGHKNVLEQKSDLQAEWWHNPTTVVVSGTIELWIRISRTNGFNDFSLMFGQWAGVFIRITGNQIEWYSSFVGIKIPYTPVANTWMHWRIDFETGSGEYLGLSPDSCNFYIDGEQYIDNQYGYYGATMGSITKIHYKSTQYLTYTWFDAIDVSWEDGFAFN